MQVQIYGIIYKATNLINGKMYIGQTTTTLKERISSHYGAISSRDTIFYNALKKYGKDNFNWIIIDRAYSRDELNEKEKYWIKYYNTFIKFDNCKGYNMTVGGEGVGKGESHPLYNAVFTEEHRRKLKENHANVDGVNNPMARAIIKLTLNGDFLEEYQTMKDTNLDNGNISNCCKGNLKSYKGFLWIYKEDYNDEYVTKRVSQIKDKGVIQLDLDGNFISEYNSATEAERLIGGLHQSIIKCCKGKIKTHKGYKWVYRRNYEYIK